MNAIKRFVGLVCEKFSGAVRVVRVASAFALALVGLGVGSSVMAPLARATIDLTDVTDAIGEVKTAVLAVVGTTIAAGLALAAVMVGGKWVWKLFKRFTS